MFEQDKGRRGYTQFSATGRLAHTEPRKPRVVCTWPKWRVNYNISESGHDSRVSYLTGKPLADKATSAHPKPTAAAGLQVRHEDVHGIEERTSVTLAYDGLDPLPPMFCYLKPYFNDLNKPYFHQLADGQL